MSEARPPVPALSPRAEIRRILAQSGAPRVTERKIDVDGTETTAACLLVYPPPGNGAAHSTPPRDTTARSTDARPTAAGDTCLYHEVDRPWEVGPLTIGPPRFTVATYWRDTPFNLYTWFEADGSFVAGYFNIVTPEGYRGGVNEVVYEDMVLDLLVDGDGRHHLLDEEEAERLDPTRRAQAYRAVAELRDRAETLIRSSVEAAREALASRADSVS